MSKLIALVATAVMVDGERTVIQPGEELPELSSHDQRELLQSGAAQNPDDEAAKAKADERAAAKAAAEFEAARQRVIAERASTQAEATGDGDGDGDAGASAGKPAAKTARKAK